MRRGRRWLRCIGRSRCTRRRSTHFRQQRSRRQSRVPKSTTKPSTPRLSDIARHVVAPKGAVSTEWPAVEAKSRELGVKFRLWQRLVGRLILAKRADGKYAATIGGVGLSIARQ